MIYARGLTKQFGYRTVLRGIDLGIRPGEIIGLLGPNGAGKSTLLRVLATLTKPNAGEARVAGYDISRKPAEARARLGFSGHQPLLYGDLSAEQNLNFYANLYQVPQVEKRVSELLDLFSLDHRRREPVRNFSRGMQQRLAFARAILHRPKVLLLDEPFSALDKEATALVEKLISDLAKQGCAVLLATHDLVRAAALAHRIELLVDGRLVSAGERKLSAKRLSVIYDLQLRKSHAG